MLFNSFNFLLFFPIVTLFYFALPHKYRWFMLLVASCMFYMFFIPIYILILLITILIDYFAGIWIEKSKGKNKKFYLIISIISTCLVLLVFKYFNFFITNVNTVANLLHWNYSINVLEIILPIGLSFHTFQSLSYVIEVYRGNQKSEGNFGIYALYVMFYPQLVAGPIERPQNLLHQFYEKHQFEFNRVSQGLKMMLWGMFKKVVIADRLAIYVNSVYNNQDNHSGISLLVATIFFAFQIYCDFSGYSDIAIGSAKVMGFDLMTNFRRPYFSKSISEFWKRWHISLSTWFRDYLYISLGGNRVKTKSRWYFNLFITFAVSGLWHGANWTYVIWGALNGFYLVFAIWIDSISNKFKNVIGISELPRVDLFIQLITTFILTLIAWVFFRANSFNDAISILSRMFTFEGKLFLHSLSFMTYAVFGIFFLLLVEFNTEYKIIDLSFFENKYTFVRYASYVSLVILILLIGVFDGSQFIYFQF